jgi:hypothetical protein
MTTTTTTEPTLIIRNRLVSEEFVEACGPLASESAKAAALAGVTTRTTPPKSGTRLHHEFVCPTIESVQALAYWVGFMLDLLTDSCNEGGAGDEWDEKRNQIRRRNAFRRVNARLMASLQKHTEAQGS